MLTTDFYACTNRSYITYHHNRMGLVEYKGNKGIYKPGLKSALSLTLQPVIHPNAVPFLCSLIFNHNF